jgi:tetratricopeptide (TPR) repeat protein
MPRNAEARLILASALIRLGQLEPAIIQLELARKQLPRNWMIPYRLSEALMRAGRADESLEALQSAAEIHPSNPEIQARLRSMKSRLSGPQ